MDALGVNPCQYESVDVAGEALAALLDAIRATRMDGGVLIGRFRAVRVAEPAQWFRARSFAEADTNVRDLLTSNALRTSLPELMVPHPYPLASPPRFPGGSGGTLTLDGELALRLVHGGAYVRFPGSAAEAKKLAIAGTHDLVGDRHEDFDVYFSDSAWSPYFMDVAWDATWLLVDRGRLEVTVLAMTDTD